MTEKNQAVEERDGLRSLKVITRDIPTIELEDILIKAGWLVEYTGGIMLVTRPAVLAPLLHRLECAEQLAANHTNHEEECILNYFEAGECTPDGGYRQKIKGKWYQSKPIDNTPKCDCGVSEKYEAWLRSKREGRNDISGFI